MVRFLVITHGSKFSLSTLIYTIIYRPSATRIFILCVQDGEGDVIHVLMCKSCNKKMTINQREEIFQFIYLYNVVIIIIPQKNELFLL